MKLAAALAAVLKAREDSNRPLAVLLTGHNGSGKSTLWYEKLAPVLEMPLINADRMMMSILPPGDPRTWQPWARTLRDEDLQ